MPWENSAYGDNQGMDSLHCNAHLHCKVPYKEKVQSKSQQRGKAQGTKSRWNLAQAFKSPLPMLKGLYEEEKKMNNMNNKMAVYTYLSIITLNANRLTAQIKRYTVAEHITK